LNDVVAGMDKMLHRLIGENIELTATLAPALGAVRADRGQLEQVIVNLVVNARDALPQGGKISIETANVDFDNAPPREDVVVPSGPYVMLAVSDTGTGMDAETKARIFEPFFSTKELGKGTGLGLSTVYGIVKQSDGYIWVYSEPGQGATFKAYFPRVAATPERAPEAPKPPVRLTGSGTILVVEDQPEVRRLMQKALAARGYEVLVAADGAEALRVAEHFAGRIDLLLSDVVMPGMSGREVGLLLAAARPTIKTLFVSGYTDGTIVHHGLLDPGIAFLQKPFTPEILARKVREVLEAAPETTSTPPHARAG
jgi:two-component system, cell cycle sensor histidine kinase and response regulator CckA